MASASDLAKRALVTLIRLLAGIHCITTDVKRDSPVEGVRQAYRALSRKVHPDRGGTGEDQQKLNAAYEKWSKLLKGTCPAGRPKNGQTRASAKQHADQPARLSALGDGRQAFRIKSAAVLLTYQGVTDVAQWRRLVDLFRGSRPAWKVKLWTATLESNTDGTLHAHLMLQFYGERDCTVQAFCFEGLRPNAQANDTLGEGWCRTPGRHQVSVDRGHFYVWANKKGTVVDDMGCLCVAANYTPSFAEGSCSYVVKAWCGQGGPTAKSDRQTDRDPRLQTDKQKDEPTDRQAGRQTGRQADRQTDRQTDQHTDRQTDRKTDRKTDRQRD